MKKTAIGLVVLLVFTSFFLSTEAGSVAVCRQSLYPSLFGEYQSCPTDQTSFFSPHPPPPECSDSWMKTFGGQYSEGGRSVEQTSDKGYIVAASKPDSLLSPVGWLIKTDASGNEEWNETLGTPYSSLGLASQIDGGYIVSGLFHIEGSPSTEAVWLVKTDSTGKTCDYLANNGECSEGNLFSKTFKGINGTSSSGIAKPTQDGGYIIFGSTNAFGAGGEDIWLIKTDAQGNTCNYSRTGNCDQNGLFAKTIGVPLNDNAAGGVQTSDGYVIASSTYLTRGESGNGENVWLIKTNANGETCEYWKRPYGNCSDDKGFSRTFEGIENVGDVGKDIKQTADGGYIVLAETWVYGKGSSIWLIKTDSSGLTCDYFETGECTGNGVFVKLVTQEEQNHDVGGSSVYTTADGGYIVTGDSWSFENKYDLLLVKIDDQGDEEWRRTFIGEDTDEKNDNGDWVEQTTDKGYIITGGTTVGGPGEGEADAWLIKTDPNGDVSGEECEESKCLINPSQVELTVDEEDSVLVECPGGCSSTGWNIFKEGDTEPYDGPAVKITGFDDSQATLISTEEFGIIDGFTLEVTTMSNGQEISCNAVITSTAPGAFDDYYELGLTTDKEVYRQGEDTNITALFLARVIGGGEGSVELKYFLKNESGEIISQGSQVVNYTQGIGNYEWIISPLPPFGIYQIGGELPVKDDEKHTSNNRAQKFVTVLEQNREVNIPEISPVLVVLVALSVVLVVKKGKKKLN